MIISGKLDELPFELMNFGIIVIVTWSASLWMLCFGDSPEGQLKATTGKTYLWNIYDKQNITRICRSSK